MPILFLKNNTSITESYRFAPSESTLSRTEVQWSVNVHTRKVWIFYPMWVSVFHSLASCELERNSISEWASSFELKNEARSWFILPLKVELQDYILSNACLMSSRISSTSSMPTERRMRSGAMPASRSCSSESWRWVLLAGWSTQVRASATWVTWWYNPSCRRPLRRSADILACYFRSPISELESGIGLYFYTPSFSFIDEKRDKNEEIFVHTRKSC